MTFSDVMTDIRLYRAAAGKAALDGHPVIASQLNAAADKLAEAIKRP